MTTENNTNAFDAYLAGEKDYTNLDLMANRHDSEMGIASMVTGAAIATVIDAGASIWNSLTPDSMAVDERDLMQRVSNDAAQMYDEHTDAIQAAGFIAGSFIPGGIALKGMKFLRAGAKGASWFSTAGKMENLAKVDTLVRNGAASTKELRALNMALLRNGVANNVLDSAVMEVATLGAMNENPLLEDYWADPVKNFGISLAFGGVIGGGIGHIGDRALVKGAAATAEKGILNTVFKDIKGAAPGDTNLGQLMALKSDVATWENLLTKQDLDPAVREMTQFHLLETKNKLDDQLKNVSFKETEALTVEDRAAILDKVVSTPSFSTANKLKFFTPSEKELENVMGKTSKKASVLTSSNPAKVTSKVVAGNKVDNINDSVYHPEWDSWSEVDVAHKFSRFNALGKDTKDLKAFDVHGIGDVNRTDIALKSLESPVLVDGNYLAALHHVDTMDLTKRSSFVVDKADLYVLDALIARSIKEPSAFDKISIKIPQKTADYATAEPTINLRGNVVKADSLTIADVKVMAATVKEDLIKSMLAKGEPLQSIAIKTNVPIDTVSAYALTKNKKSLFEYSEEGLPIHHYTSAEAIPSYLSPTTRPIRATHSLDKLDFAAVQAKLNNKTNGDIQREYMSTLFATTKSSIMQDLGNSLVGSSTSPRGLMPVLEQIRQNVAELSNSNLGSPFINSADFFLRNASTGKSITYVGKVLSDAASKGSLKITSPIAKKMAVVARDEVAVIEANTFLNTLAGLKGWRDVENGVLMQKEIQEVTQMVNGVAKKVKQEVKVPVQVQGADYTISHPAVLELIDELKKAGTEAFHMKNTLNKVTGRASIPDLGIWVPSTDFRDKHIAYVWNKVTNQTKILYGKTANELEDQVGLYSLLHNEQIVRGESTVATKSEQALYNNLRGRNDPLTMQVANVAQQKTGSSASAITKANTDAFTEILGAYNYLVESNVKRMGQYMMSDTIDTLDSMSKFNKKFTEGQSTSVMTKFLNKEEDGAAKVRNVLLGSSNLKEYTPWQTANENFETVVNYGVNTISDVIQSATKPLTGIFGKGKGLSAELLAKQDYKVISEKLAEAGVVNPWAVYDDAIASQLYGVAKLKDASNVAKRAVYAGNAFAATMALRVLDIASPLVNIMSLPILTSLAKIQNLPPALLNASRNMEANPSMIGIMYDGVRLSNSKRGEELAAAWEKLGHLDSFVSEANAAMRTSRSIEKGVLGAVESGIDNKLVDMLSKPADAAEAFLRRKTMFSGYVLAKKIYPTIDDTGATIFARDFMDRSMGNYHSGQRPVFFQGTMGVAMGLFQTYLLTLGQNIYRGIELKDYKNLGKAMLAQSTIFGAQSLPGYEMVSTTIGDHFSDENIDLSTGTFRAVGDSAATAILYGLPSSLGPALHTRGDISPRIPVPFGDMTKIAAVNLVGQTLQLGSDMASAAKDNGGDITKSVAQALSLQSVSRPLARMSELVTGNSVSRAGDVYASPEEVYTPMGVFARVLGARTIEEAKAREGIYADKNYSRMDRETRMEYTGELKKAIRNGTLTEPLLSDLAARFMRKGGSARAWNSAVNEAMANSNLTGAEQSLAKIRPDSPLMHMMEGLDGEQVN